MHRIDTATKSTDLFGAGKHGFKDGDKANASPATDLTAAFFNDIQENLAGVIEAAGIALVKGDYTQLRAAIQAMIVGAQKAVTISNATFEASVADGEVVRWDAGNTRFDEAIADGTVNNRAVGVADVTNAKVYIYGECALFTGLTPGARYYLNAATPGAVADVAPADGITIGIAKSATTLFVDIDALGVQSNQANNFSKGQSGTVAALPATTGTLTFDFTAASNFSGQVTGACTFGNGYTVPGAGKATWFCIRVQQDAATLRNWAFGTNWQYTGGSAAIPAQTQTLNAWDEILGQVLTDGTISFAVRSDVKS
ncbi:MAG: hypothetical protein Q7U97_02405 [Rhodocyclaceae bacterium]|nr:hypothetical protein [Rhodocyclaceae bacterium]